LVNNGRGYYHNDGWVNNDPEYNNNGRVYYPDYGWVYYPDYAWVYYPDYNNNGAVLNPCLPCPPQYDGSLFMQALYPRSNGK
jgi:hypothetical protein